MEQIVEYKGAPPRSVPVVLAPAAVANFSMLDSAMSFDEAKAQHQYLRKCVAELLVEGVDYGIIPGTSRKDEQGNEIAKKVLFKPGAEHLCQLFRLRPEFQAISITEDFDKGLFFYRYRCNLIHIPSGYIVGQGIGSCSSYESKYRYRQGNLVCPECQKETVFRSKQVSERTGKKGFFCWAKKGGCGANFHSDEPKLINQDVGRKENPDLADLTNTCDKQAQKRSLVGAALITVGCSEYFTQDLDDDVDPKTGEVLPKGNKSGVSGTGTPAPASRGTEPHENTSPPSEPDAASEEKQKPASGISSMAPPFNTVERGRADIFNILNKALELKVEGMDAATILTQAFDMDMTPKRISEINDLELLKTAWQHIERFTVENKK